MHQLPGPQAPRREPQGISLLEEFSFLRALLTGCRNGEWMFNFREEFCPDSQTPVSEVRRTVAEARHTQILVMESRARSPIASPFHPTHHKRKQGQVSPGAAPSPALPCSRSLLWVYG